MAKQNAGIVLLRAFSDGRMERYQGFNDSLIGQRIFELKLLTPRSLACEWHFIAQVIAVLLCKTQDFM